MRVHALLIATSCLLGACGGGTNEPETASTTTSAGPTAKEECAARIDPYVEAFLQDPYDDATGRDALLEFGNESDEWQIYRDVRSQTFDVLVRQGRDDAAELASTIVTNGCRLAYGIGD